MSEVNETAANPTGAPVAVAAQPSAVAGAASAAPAAAAPAKPRTAIQIIEQEIVGYFKQREEAIARVHAIDGAIQSAQHILMALKAEAAKGIALVEKGAKAVVAETEKIAGEVETAVETVAKDVESKVVSIESAKK